MTLDTRGVEDLIINYNLWFAMHDTNTTLDITNVTGVVTFQDYNTTGER